MTALRKKLIEVSLPLEAINKASAREKSIRHGHPSTLHLWWARRPLAACRAVLFAQLVDDPSAWPERFPTAAAVEAERARLHKVIADLVPWEASNDQTILQAARWEIARSVAWGRGEAPPAPEDAAGTLRYLLEKAPPVYDPFSGGGSIPLEAQRLGLRAHGSDLNPVAVLIGKALVEIPPKFAGQPPVNPAARAALPAGGWRGAAGLAEDVRYYGAWMREEAARRIGHLYPKARLPDGGEATVIAWIWARTVRSPDPAAKGAMVPLVSSFMLSTKEGRKTWAEVVPDPTAPDGWRFVVHGGALATADEERLKKGTKSAKGGAFVCVLTGSAIPREYVQAEGKADRLGDRLMATVVEWERGRRYLAPDAGHEMVAAGAVHDPMVSEARSTFLSPATPTRAMITGGVCSAYGLRTWGHLFTPRQLVALITFSDLVAGAREQALSDARVAGLSEDAESLHAGGNGLVAYADAVATYLALGVSRLTDAQNALCQWGPGADQTQHLFRRQAIPMVWDYAESNVFSDAAGDLRTSLASMCRVLTQLGIGESGGVYNVDAPKNSFPIRPVIISTDPPYYDNIGYADLSDFFYVWMRRSLASTWPALFRRLTSPKDAELVATPSRHGGKEAAEAFFLIGMREALAAMRAAAVEDAPLAIYYAYKQAEASAEGITSPGWTSFLQAVVDSGLGIDGTWPIRTERGARSVAIDANALASSIVLVCRKRPDDAPVATRADFVRALRRELPQAVKDIRAAGVGPVDMQQSVIGPGMGVFTRFACVLEDDDSPMPVRTALALINRAWDEIENEAQEALDAPTQVALAWFAAYGMEQRPAGDLITLANAKDVPIATLFAAEVFHDGRGKASLMPRNQLPADWSPARDKHPTAWECVQHAIRLLNAEDGGAEAAAELVAAMGPLAEPARDLTYRLFQIATGRGWAAEALAYNALAEEWPRLLEMKPETVARGPARDRQAELFGA